MWRQNTAVLRVQKFYVAIYCTRIYLIDWGLLSPPSGNNSVPLSVILVGSRNQERISPMRLHWVEILKRASSEHNAWSRIIYQFDIHTLTNINLLKILFCYFVNLKLPCQIFKMYFYEIHLERKIKADNHAFVCWVSLYVSYFKWCFED